MRYPLALLFDTLWRLAILPLFFFNDTATTEIYTLSLHDALPIYHDANDKPFLTGERTQEGFYRVRNRSEEHTSELQSHLNLVCRLLLEKKKKSRQYQSGGHVTRRTGTSSPHTLYACASRKSTTPH